MALQHAMFLWHAITLQNAIFLWYVMALQHAMFLWHAITLQNAMFLWHAMALQHEMFLWHAKHRKSDSGHNTTIDTIDIILHLQGPPQLQQKTLQVSMLQHSHGSTVLPSSHLYLKEGVRLQGQQMPGKTSTLVIFFLCPLHVPVLVTIRVPVPTLNSCSPG